MSNIQPLIISPPFGNYIHHKLASSIHGTFTLNCRPGLIKQVFKTVRPIWSGRQIIGYYNKIGLRNRGLYNIVKIPHNISIAAIGKDDWNTFLDYFDDIIPSDIVKTINIEINVGCQNTVTKDISPKTAKRFIDKFNQVIIKIPGDITTDNLIVKADWINRIGAIIHISNTLPTPRGSLSGTQLKRLNIPRVESVHELFPNLPIVAGGGIYTFKDFLDYKEVGATYFSLSTIFFTPWKAAKLLTKCKKRWHLLNPDKESTPHVQFSSN